MKHYLIELKEHLEKELEKVAKSGEMSMASLDKAHKLTDTIKNICKIEMLDEEGEHSYGMGGAYGSSYKRDGMGRYSRDGGASEEMHHGSSYYDGYSRGDAKDHLLSKLGAMMEGADSNVREILKDAMRKIER